MEEGGVESSVSRIYTPKSGMHRPWRLLIDIFRGFKNGRHLAYRLFIRDLRASVRQSYLGFFWLFLPAIATAGIWIFLNNQKVVEIENVPMAYPAFALCGTIIWALFTESVNKPIQRFNSAKGMMAKLNFPRESLLLAAFYDLCFSFFLKLLVLIPALLLFGVHPSINWIFAILGILLLFLFGFSLGLIIMPLALLYTDINRGLSFIFQIFMYLSPVIYPIGSGSSMALIQKYNPISPFIEFIRSNFGDYYFDLGSALIFWSVISTFIFIVGMILVKVALSAILERVGA